MLIVLTFILNAGLNFLLGLAIAGVLGPAEFGRFAIGSMAAIVLGTALFDWLRLSATRHYNDGSRASDPALRATLEAAYLGFGAFALLITLGLVAFGIDLGLSLLVLAAAVALALANARFDFTTALARARFLEGPHALLMAGKNVLAFAIGIGAAFWFKSAAAALAGLAVAAALAILPARSLLRDGEARLKRAEWGRLGRFARYGIPIVAANVIYQAIVLINRTVVAGKLGFADAGQLSLATDMSIRLILAVGAALDVYLFQLVVRKDAQEGRAAAHAQVRRNILIVTAVLALLAVGYAGAMPAFEAVLVPAKYRGAFGPVSLLLLPGIVLFCLVNFALNPIFQLEGRTGPVVWAAALALVVDLAGVTALPPGFGIAGFALVHSVSLGLAAVMAAALAFRDKACRPPIEHLLWIAAATCAAALALWPTRQIGEPILAMAAAAVAGTSVYLAVLLGGDVAGLRGTAAEFLARRRSRHSRHRAQTPA